MVYVRRQQWSGNCQDLPKYSPEDKHKPRQVGTKKLNGENVQGGSMNQPSRIAWMIVLAGALLLVPSRVGAQSGSGALKVTSFPSGANVAVDGVDTGKVTPMSISLAVGTHTVVVSIPNSSWNADTRSVDVASGNNDLSVTLLPASTIGPIGPPGPKGDPGP